VELAPGAADALPVVQQRGQVALAMGVGETRVGAQHGREPQARIFLPLAGAGELVEVVGDLPLLPGEQDRLDIREVLVEGRAADAGVLGDLRHGDRGRPVRLDEFRGHRQDRLVHRLPVALDGLVPQPRHQLSIQTDQLRT
jgi:hypothetical protein